MKANTFFQVCIFTCIALIIFTMSINFVNALGVFGMPVKSGFEPGNTTNETFEDITNVEYTTQEGATIAGIDALFLSVLSGGIIGIGGVAIGVLMRSTAIMGVSIFSSIFWASYINSLGVLNIGGYLPFGFIAIGTVAMSFVWGGAVAGMLSGSG